MRRTEAFRLQHAELLAIAERIERALERDRVARGADTMRGVLALLARVLHTHSAHEDRQLYPLLLKHADERIRGRARSLRDDFGIIYASVEVAANYWGHAGNIEREPARFVDEMRTLLSTLRTRIELENDDLYRMVDAL